MTGHKLVNEATPNMEDEASWAGIVNVSGKFHPAWRAAAGRRLPIIQVQFVLRVMGIKVDEKG